MFDTQVPIVAAPMAGGPSTVELASAVSEAGGFAFLAGGYKEPTALADEMAGLRARGRPFGVNLFAPGVMEVETDAFAAYAQELGPEAEAHGVSLDPEPVIDDDHWEAKLRLLHADPVAVVSFTFALPGPEVVASLQSAGSRVLATITTAEEARVAQEAGVDGLIVQGAAAGGHSATLNPHRDPEDIPTSEAVARVRRQVDLPVVAAGGVDGPAAVDELLAVGARAVVVGTLLLRTDEAGTSATHRAALADPRFDRTALTRAFTGRPARALVNGFTERHREAPTAYPAVHHLTRELRRAAGAAGDTDRLHLWAGTGYRQAPTGPAAEVVRWLAD